MTERIASFSSIIIASLVALLGLSVMLGWHFSYPFLLQYQDKTIAMVFNTALCFVLSALAINLLIHEYHTFVRVICLMIIGLSAMVLIQHISNIDLGLDQLFLAHMHSNELNPYPGRMAPNTCLSFILSAAIILMLTHLPSSHRLMIAISLLNILLFLMAIFFISGYVADYWHAYTWGKYTPMALNTAIGFILLAISIALTMWHQCLRHKIYLWRVIPFSVGMGMFLINLLIALAAHQNNLEHHTSNFLPWIIFMLGSVFALLFGLLLYFLEQVQQHIKREKRLTALAEATLEAVAEGVVAISITGAITHVNNKMLHIWHLTPKDTTQDIIVLIEKMAAQAQDPNTFRQLMKLHLQPDVDTNQSTIELTNNRHMEIFSQAQKVNNKTVGKIISFHDISMIKLLEADLMHQNTHDTLTDLPNKSMLVELLNMSINASHNNNHQIGVFLIDIERFTQVNDVFGRSKGDQLLIEVVGRLKPATERFGTLCRLGGDEFVLVANMNHIGESDKIIEAIFSAFKTPFELYGTDLNISCAIGIALSPHDSQKSEDLLRFADIAMFKAKKQGRNSHMFYTRHFNDTTVLQMKLENDLYIAIDQAQFELYYQPQISLKNNQVVGVEALLRWHNHRLGLLTPDAFLNTAEELGLMNDIGHFVIKQSLKQMSIWKKKHLEGFKMAINISAHQFQDCLLMQQITDAMREYQVSAKEIEIELTEQAFIEGSAEVYQTLSFFNNLGASIAMDDFGTGYSSLNYIKRFPLDVLKIDQSFIHDMMRSGENQKLVSAIIQLGKSLNLKIIAEGVEHIEQLDFLTKEGCDMAQGYFFAKPMPANEIPQFIKQYHKKGLSSTKS